MATTRTQKDLKADLQADLLIDLAGPAVEEPPALAVQPSRLPPELSDATPSLSLALTPLRWSRPKLVSVRGGLGKAVKVGPLRVELAIKE